MAFNKDEMHAPAWTDQAFFEKVLKHSEKDSTITVDTFKIVPGSNAGDHYASIIFRAAVSYRSRGKDLKTSLIVKTIPAEEGHKKELLKNGALFETETLMYDTVLPEMYRLLKIAGDDTELGPRLLYSSSDPHWMMVFSDLSVRGYTVKPSQMDLEESKMMYTKLARWHATSTFLVDSMPMLKTLDKGLGTMDLKEFKPLWSSLIITLSKACRNWPGYESYADKLEQISEKIFDKLYNIYSLDESTRYYVLNHGDLHSKNCMYKIVNGKTEDILLLDYQISMWGSPAIDIIYSMYNAVNYETRNGHRDELIKFYYDEYVAALNRFGYLKKTPTLVDLHVEITRCGHLETFLICTFLPFMILTMEELMPQPPPNAQEEGFEFDFANENKMTEMIRQCLQHPKCETAMKKYLPMLLYKGLLDM
uniref:Putative ecdysteroid kinase n=1 Tax=Culex tarsalis TaxID=7177 RepID=A0A1Q3FRF5_CULTA